MPDDPVIPEEQAFHYFDPSERIENLSGNLPHWRQGGTIYFVTFRLNDSIPQERLRQWSEEREAWMRAHPEPHSEEVRREYYRLYPHRLQAWLDAGVGSCILDRPRIKAMVEKAMTHFDGVRYRLDERIVMPNHIHVLVTPLEGYLLSDTVGSWKSFTSHQTNRMLGTTGQNWQKESFDHIVRSPEQLAKLRRYIRDNPKWWRRQPLT